MSVVAVVDHAAGTLAQGYGLTETMAIGCVNRGVDYLKHPTSCGRPIPVICEVAILDPTTHQRVPDGERGEVCLKGAFIMKGASFGAAVLWV